MAKETALNEIVERGRLSSLGILKRAAFLASFFSPSAINMGFN